MNTNNSLKCPLCGNADHQFVRKYRARTSLFENKRLLKCPACDFFYVDPMLDDQTLDEYNASYYLNAHGRNEYDDKQVCLFKGIAKARWAHIRKYLDQVGVELKSVLEIGPGFGYLADQILEEKCNINYTVLETDLNRHQDLADKGIRIFTAMEELSGDEDQYDLIIISHVLEHVNDPLNFLGQIIKKSRSAGVLFCEVPCMDFLFKPADEPHLLFFNKKSMGILMGQLDVEKVSLSYHGSPIHDLKKKKKIYESLPRLIKKQLGMLPVKKLECDVTEEELLAINKYHVLDENVEPSWWLRAMAVVR